MSAPDPKAIERARALAKKGDVDGAVRAFVAADAPEDAARALASAARYVEAADLLLGSLGMEGRALGQLREPRLRARAKQAAALLRQGGMARAADELEDSLERTGLRFGTSLPSIGDDDEGEKTVLNAERSPFDAEEKTELNPPGRRPLLSATIRPPSLRPPPPPERHGVATLPAHEVAPAHEPPRPKMVEPLPPAGEPRRPSRGAPVVGARPPSLGSRSLDAFAPGTVIGERYRLGPLVGRGGMGRVFRATDLELGQEIAIKVFDRMDDSTLLARFKQELLSSRQIAHPNVLRIFDIGTHADQKYLTMELLVGQDLKERLQQPIAFSESLDLLVQACRGLAAAHAVGVIHRDIKPQNLFLTQQKLVKLMDFGIAKLQAAARLTSPGSGVGTPEFMAPEQIKDASTVSAATDLYAIGVTAYRMFTGRVPFQDKDLLKLLKKQMNEDPPPPRQLNPKIPPQLEAIIVRLLAKKPAERYQRATEVADAFAAIRARIATSH